MNVEIVQTERVRIVRVDGTIDAKTTPLLAEAMTPALASKDDLILDLTAVTFVSSAGLRLLLVAYRKLREESRSLILAGVGDDVRRVMSHTGFVDFFTFAETQADALAALAPG